MAVTNVEAGAFLFPHLPHHGGYTSVGGTTFQINANGERAALIMRVPKTGTVDKFAARIHTVTDAPDNGARFSFQDVDLSNGLPDGSVDQFATVASGSVTAGWLDPGTFDSGRSVTRGDYLALVIDIPTFTAGDNFAVGGSATVSNSMQFPYGVSNSAKDATNFPAFALHYNDSTWTWIPHVYPHSSVSSVTYNSGTGTADEWGTAWSVPFPCKAWGVEVNLAVASGADFEAILYDSDGSTALATTAHDGSLATTAGTARLALPFPSEVSLTANTNYRVAIRPTTGNNVTLSYMVLPDGDIMRYCWEGGDNLYMTSRLNQTGAWTDYNSGTFRRVPISLLVSAFDNGSGSAAEHSHVFVG